VNGSTVTVAGLHSDVAGRERKRVWGRVASIRRDNRSVLGGIFRVETPSDLRPRFDTLHSEYSFLVSAENPAGDADHRGLAKRA